MRDGSLNGSPRRNRSLIRLKIVVFSPIPSASVRTATRVNPGDLRSWRTANLKSFKFAVRQLRKSPGFTLVAVLTLALGIGLNTTIFSLINDLFLRGLPFKEPSRIVHLDNGDKGRDLADVG